MTFDDVIVRDAPPPGRLPSGCTFILAGPGPTFADLDRYAFFVFDFEPQTLRVKIDEEGSFLNLIFQDESTRQAATWGHALGKNHESVHRVVLKIEETD